MSEDMLYLSNVSCVLPKNAYSTVVARSIPQKSRSHSQITVPPFTSLVTFVCSFCEPLRHLLEFITATMDVRARDTLLRSVFRSSKLRYINIEDYVLLMNYLTDYKMTQVSAISFKNVPPLVLI